MARANHYSHAVTSAAARHSDFAYALRELEIALHRAAWASEWVDYQDPLRTPKSKQVSWKTEHLFKEANNVAAKRRRFMKQTPSKDAPIVAKQGEAVNDQEAG